MTIDFWACLIIAQIYFIMADRENKAMMAFGAIAWFILSVCILFSNLSVK